MSIMGLGYMPYSKKYLEHELIAYRSSFGTYRDYRERDSLISIDEEINE